MEQRSPVLLITGASGFIGNALVLEALKRSFRVIAAVRSIPKDRIPGVDYKVFNLEHPEFENFTEKIDCIIHAAYIKTDANKHAAQLNITAGNLLIRFAKQQNISCCIFLSSLSAKPDALSVYGQQKHELETAFLNHDFTVVKPGLVLGNGGLFQSMKQHLEKSSWIPLFGNGQQPVQTVHIDDLTTSVFTILKLQLKGAYIIAENTPVPYKTFYEELCASLGKKARFIRLSFALTELALRCFRLFGIRMPVSPESLKGLRQMNYVSSAESLSKLDLKISNYKESLKRLSGI